jgi:hypothetical protein
LRVYFVARKLNALGVSDDDPVPQNGPGIVRAHGLVRP